MAMTFAVDDPSTDPSSEGTKAGLFDVDWRSGLSSYLGHPRIKAARGWLDSLRRAVLHRTGATEFDESEPLRLEVIRLYEDGLYYEAEVEARRLVELQMERVGESHPDFATVLSNLALLLQQQGDLKGAEALLVQTMTIRREAPASGTPISPPA